MTKANSTHISLQTAKLLKDCGVESKQVFVESFSYSQAEPTHGVYVSEFTILMNADKERHSYPCFSWQEILWEHAEEFFGDDEVDTHSALYHRVWEAWHVGTMTEQDFERIYEPAFIYRSTEIKNLLQEKKYDEADEYFRKHCILITQSSHE